MKERYLEMINRESEYLDEQEVGTDEYNASVKRLNELLDKLNELEKADASRKDQKFKNGLEVAKVVTGVAVPVGISYLVIKVEETGSLRSALKGIINTCLPRKMF